MTGTGTQIDPYIIMTADDLYSMDALGGSGIYFKLGANIDFNETAYAESFVSIPLKCAELDGNGYYIRNIYANNPTGEASLFTLYSKAICGEEQTLKNLKTQNITLFGKSTHFFGDSSGAGKLLLNNCELTCKFKATAEMTNGTSGYNGILSSSNRRLHFYLCTLIIDADLFKTHPLWYGGSFSRSQMRLNLTVASGRSYTSSRESMLYQVDVNDSYFFGTITQTGEAVSGSNDFVFAMSGVHTNSYQVIEYTNFSNVYYNANFGSACFYDRTVAGNVPFKSANGSNFNLLYELSTAQCKDSAYLQSIGFLTEGTD